MTIRVQNRHDQQLAPNLPADRILPPPCPEPAAFAHGTPRSANAYALAPLRRIHEDRVSDASSPRDFGVSAPTPSHHSSIDTPSPNPILTPTTSTASLSTGVWSATQPSSHKRVKRESVSSHGLRLQGNSRGKSDLAGLLNPAPEDPVVYSPRMPELEHGQTSPMTSVQSNSPRPSLAGHGQIGTRTLESVRFVRLEPRPIGQNYEAGTNGDVDGEEEAERKRKGRRGPLKNDERRAEVLEIRALGACVRCAIFRIGCEATQGDQPCKPCLDTLPKARKFRVRCTRKWLKDRWEFLLPLSLIDHLDLRTGNWPDVKRTEDDQVFKVPMTPGFFGSVSVNAFAVKVEDIGRADNWLTNWFNPAEDGPDAKVIASQVPSMPMMPILDDRTAFAPIREWVIEFAAAVVRDEVHACAWVDFMFEGMMWPRQVLKMVCRFYQQAVEGCDDQCPALEIALTGCFLRYLLGRIFYIPHQELALVNQYLPAATALREHHLMMLRPDDEIAPRFLDRYIKCAIFEVVKVSLQNTFYELDKSFRLLETKREDQKLSALARDKIFCVILILLILAGTTQNKILQKARSKIQEQQRTHGIRHPMDDRECVRLSEEAHHCVRQVEVEVVDHVLDLWSYKFPKLEATGKIEEKETRASQEAKNLQVIKDFQDSIQLYPDLRELSPVLDLTDEEKFMNNNVKRMLLRFDQCLYSAKAQLRSPIG